MTKTPQTAKRWFVFCEPCAYKQIITADDPTDSELTEIKTSAIPGGVPVLDKVTKKTITKPTTPQLKKFKCPKCGRGVISKKLPEVYSKAYKEIDEETKKREEVAAKQKRLEDGKPHVRKKEDEEFIG